MNRVVPIIIVLLTAATIEALLATRVWAQVTAQPMEEAWFTSLLKVTDDLASPFAMFTGDEPMHTTGVIDFTVLVAIEGYFIAMLALVAFIYAAGRVGSLFGRPRRHPLPAFMAAQREPEALPQIWQPVPTPRAPGATIYVPMQRKDRTAAHERGSLG